MITIKIEPCDHNLFKIIREQILNQVPFALVNDVFDSDWNRAFFTFWDTRYVPKELMRFAMIPPATPKYDFSEISLPEAK